MTLTIHVAGRLSSGMKQTGKILINGHKQALAYGTSVRKFSSKAATSPKKYVTFLAKEIRRITIFFLL